MPLAEPASSTRDNPIDRALVLDLSGDSEAALRWSCAVVASDPRLAGPLFVASRLVARLGRRQAGIVGLDTAAARAVEAGNLALAMAACCELAAWGADTSAALDEISSTFARGSLYLMQQDASQAPRFAAIVPAVSPLSESLCGDALLDEVTNLLSEAAQKLAAARAGAAPRPRVSPQPLFSALDEDGLRAMIGIFEVMTVAEGAVLIEQGAQGSEAYVVARGELEVQRMSSETGVAPIRLARLGAGALFGEMALLSRAPRAARVIACRPSVLLVARKEGLDEVAAQKPEIGRQFALYCRRRMLDNLVRTSSVLRAVRPQERQALMEMFVTRTFEEHDKIITQGQASEGLHLIASGEVVVVHKDGEESTVIAELGPGEVVGEMALVLRRPSNADVIAAHPTVTLHLPRDRFLDLIKRHPAVLSELYELAVRRDEETSTIVAQEATDIDELVLV